jgi:hypothetical protein
MIQNSWGAPDMGPVYALGAPIVIGVGVLAAPEVGAALSSFGLSGIANAILLANITNTAIDAPTVIVEGTEQTEILADAYEFIGEQFENEAIAPPPPAEVPTSTNVIPPVAPTDNTDNACQ